MPASSMDTRLPIRHLTNANPTYIRNIGRIDWNHQGVLVEDMQEKGQLLPVLADPSFRVLDGSRRLEAARELGWTDIRVRVTDDWRLITEHFKEARKSPLHLPMTWLETMELMEAIHEILMPLAREKGVQTRRINRGMKVKKGEPTPSVTDLIPEILGMSKWKVYEFRTAWNAINDPDITPEQRQRARDAVDAVQAVDRPSTLPGAVKRAILPPLTVAVPSDAKVRKQQKNTISHALAGMRGAVLALPAPDLLDSGHESEAEGWDKEITGIIQQLTAFRKKLRETNNG